MAARPRKRKKPKLTRNRPATGPRIPAELRSKAIAFRLPPDVIAAADKAAAAKHVSRNKMVELALRDQLADYIPRKHDGQVDLFG